jgi:beta-glucanase (GH16 family)
MSGDWKLILDSEFNKGQKLDTAIWRPGWFGSGITGPINQHESACYSPGNVELSADGTLHLTVSRVRSRCSHKTRPFTGAVLSTNPDDGRARGGGFTYRYGALEAKIYIPGTPDSKIADWPAVIGLGQVWPRDGENDVVENLGGLVCSHFHSPGYAPGGDLGGCDPSFTPGWHVVSSNWEPGSVTWYYDGIEIAHATKGITSAPMYLVLVNTVSSKSPGVAMPDTMRVAYVRVWQRAHAGAR